MFSGIIETIGEIRSGSETPGGMMLVVSAEDYWHGTIPGASIAIDGVCLTVTRINRNEAAFDVIVETLRRSTLGDLRPGVRVNLQKALAVGDRVDGHFVQGHVDAMGVVERIDEGPTESMWWFSTDASALPCIIPKGSIAIDGISLTIAEVRDSRFSVALIPTTLQETTIGRKRVGDRVNIETDILARTVVHALQSLGPLPDAADRPLTIESLRRQGLA